MKSPLRYQITEYDSGATAILNGISYLLDREKINPALISSVYRYSLDSGNNGDNYDDSNYSSKAIFTFISKYMNEYDKNKGYKLHFDEVEASRLDLKFIKECVSNNSSIVLPIWEDGKERYVTLTNMDDNCAYIFDPYYMDEDNSIFQVNKDIIFETDKPMEYNRVITKDRLFGHEIPYAINSSSSAYIITSNYQSEGVKIARKFDYIFEKTNI